MENKRVRLSSEHQLKYIPDERMPYVEFAYCKAGLELGGLSEGDWIRITLEKIGKPKWVDQAKKWAKKVAVESGLVQPSP